MEKSKAFNRIRIDTTKHPGYLRFLLQGPYDLEDFEAAIPYMRDLLVTVDLARALIDLREVEGNMPDFDRFNLGVRIAEVWGSSLKLAGLAPAEKINRFLENTAVNRQARVKVFIREPEALEWLLGP